MLSLRTAVPLIVLLAATPARTFASPHASATLISQDGKAAIAKVQRAAQSRDFVALRSVMANEFTWSFGGDGDADQAIEAWRADKKYLKELVAVLKRGCHAESSAVITCPGKGGFEFRAGFEKTKAGWQMKYFVAGD